MDPKPPRGGEVSPGTQNRVPTQIFERYETQKHGDPKKKSLGGGRGPWDDEAAAAWGGGSPAGIRIVVP